MDKEKLAGILKLVADVTNDSGQHCDKSMQTAMIAALIERDGRIEAAKIQALKINELACYIKDSADTIKEGLDYIAKRTC